MADSITVTYPDGTVTKVMLPFTPKAGKIVLPFVIARVETDGPDEEGNREIHIYLQKAEE